MGDLYPTRLSQRQEPLPRQDPVLHDPRGTSTPGPLSPEQLARFRRDGFLVLEQRLPATDTEAFLAEFDACARDGDLLRQPYAVAEPGGEALRSLFAVHELSARCDRLTRSPWLLDAVTQILGSDVYIHQSRINAKPAFTGRGFDWHSDFETWHAEDGMPRMRALSVSISLTDNQPLNGPLMLVPGSQHTFLPTVGATPQRYWERSLRRQQQGVPEREDLRRQIAAGGIETVAGGAGTVLLFDCNVLHASADNLSPWRRSNLFFVYNSVDNPLQAPFAANGPRPAWLASRDPQGMSAVGRTPALQVA